AVPAQPTSTLIAHKGRHFFVQLFTPGQAAALEPVAHLSEFRASQDALFVLPQGLKAGEQMYAHVVVRGEGSEELRFTAEPLDQALAAGAEHTRMIALT